MKFKNYLVILFCFIVSVTVGQTIEVKGKIFDSKSKMSIPGVNVTVKRTKKGVTTDFDGSYSIRTNVNEVLIYSIVGYSTKEIKVDKTVNLNIELSEEANKLEEVVINVGYGTQKKKYLTSAIASVKSDAFDDRPLYNVGQAIQGNAAGVNVVQPSGKPGSGLEIRIRGLSSIKSGNSPLYVIDGVQTTNADGISTDDIVDIQILKDATSTAIYGVNGSAGVILITTKRGKINKNSFNFNSYFGNSQVVRNINVLNPDQYRTLMNEVDSSMGTNYGGNIDNPKYSGTNTNWVQKVFQSGLDRNFDFSFTGGNDKIKEFASLGYQDTQGIVKPSNFSRLSGRVNIDLDAASWLKAHVNMNLLHTNLNNTSDNNSANQGGVILSALTTPSFMPVFADQLIGRLLDSSGEFNDGEKDGQFAANPVASLENPVAFQSRQEVTNVMRYLGNLSFDVTLLDNLVWKPSSTVDLSKSVYDFFVDSYRSNYGRNNGTTDATKRGIGREHKSTYYTWNYENTLNYTKRSGNQDISLLAGNSIQKFRMDQLKIEGTGFAPDLRKIDINQMMYIDRKASDTIAKEVNSVSYFSRATYIFKGKYILNGVFRASGVSKLAKGFKWGNFPGFSAAWIVSNEEFLKNSNSISELKVRGGWGKTGNVSGIGEFAAYGLLYDDHGSQANFVNDELTWETTTDKNVGLDLALFNNRIKVSVDAFQKHTKDLLNTIYYNGTAFTYNAGEIENKGVEFSMNTVNFKGNFNWSTNFNISFMKNKVINMGLNPVDYYGYSGVNKVEAGQSLGNFYGYRVDKVDPANGNLIFKDLNNDGVLTPLDRTIIGNALPDYTFGLTNTMGYKGFTLDLLVTSSQGNDIFNASRIDLEGMVDSKNQSASVLNRWTTVGQITDMPKAGTSNGNSAIQKSAVSDRWIEDGSYVRLKATTIGYNFKTMILGIKTLKLYATGQNLFTWTKYSGFDPEVSAFGGNSGTGQGIDYGTYPQVRTLIFGLKAGF